MQVRSVSHYFIVPRSRPTAPGLLVCQMDSEFTLSCFCVFDGAGDVGWQAPMVMVGHLLHLERPNQRQCYYLGWR
jgi:hypothetical protein